MRRERSGFSLIEMIAVLAILAFMVGVAAVSLAGQRRQATLESVTREVVEYDRRSRLWAERSARPIDLVMAEDGLKQESIGNFGATPSRTSLALPAGFALKEIWLAGESEPRSRVTLHIGSEGRSRSYGLRLSGPKDSTRWILIAGPTGQSTVLNDETEAREIFAILAQKRLDPA